MRSEEGHRKRGTEMRGRDRRIMADKIFCKICHKNLSSDEQGKRTWILNFCTQNCLNKSLRPTRRPKLQVVVQRFSALRFLKSLIVIKKKKSLERNKELPKTSRVSRQTILILLRRWEMSLEASERGIFKPGQFGFEIPPRVALVSTSNRRRVGTL